MTRVATIILNRNLPEPTDRLVEHLQVNDNTYTDVFVVEAGSDDNKLSQYSTWHEDSAETRRQGLRYSRGMNYGLWNLWRDGLWDRYDAFFVITNDTELNDGPTVKILLDLLDAHDHIGILSPCSRRWGEKQLLVDEKTKYFWFIHNNAYLLRRDFLDCIKNQNQDEYVSFVFDGTNFRGYGSESELIAKAYINDWAAAITTEVWAEENEGYLLSKSELIKTESYNKNLELYVEEGKQWMRAKYGFNSRWAMQQYVKSFYDLFFEFHPEYRSYKL